MKETIQEVIDFLESWDCKPTKENIKKTLIQWIHNAYSHIGVAAHEHSSTCGITDETSMTWQEQDTQLLQQIDRYKQCLMEIDLMS